RILVGILVGIFMVGMVVMAAFSRHYMFLREIEAILISVVMLIAVIEMRRALGKERIPDSFSWIIWAYGMGIGPAYILFGYVGIVFLTLLLFCFSTITALTAKRPESLFYIAFIFIYPGLLMASMLYINRCASTQYISQASPVYDYIVVDSWSIVKGQRYSQLLPYNAIGFAFIFAVSALTDVFAYFVGILFGKHKLCPNISPNKTIEGSIGGLAGGLLGSALVYWVFEVWQIFGEGLGLSIHGLSTPNLVIVYVAIGLIGSVLTQIGDLLASLIKRHCGIKDYGKILGAHGGVMDRLDGVMLNAVFVASVYMFII
ncbi:MAG: phosphatidate cytidylyltransferase, partial [Clostridia bacterium]|nr:phosphatidate cytidylyltransferase [Clostridia bacterium]